MLRSLYSGVSGLTSHQTKMDVIGNNIANVNTYGFKASRVTFRDIYYQTSKSASGGNEQNGGVNPSQVGYGVQVGSVDKIMSRSSFQSSASTLDISIAGEGFIQVQDKAGNKSYTRAGMLAVDNDGNLVDNNGKFVLGTQNGDPLVADGLSIDPGTGKIKITIPSVSVAESAKAAVTVNPAINGAVGGPPQWSIGFLNGNQPDISVTVQAAAAGAADGVVYDPAGTPPTLTVSLKDVANIKNPEELATRINVAIEAEKTNPAANPPTLTEETFKGGRISVTMDMNGMTGPGGAALTASQIAQLKKNCVESVVAGGAATLTATIKEQGFGDLTSFTIGEDGVLSGKHGVHGMLTFGRIDLTTFDNPQGLEEAGNTYFTQTVASGEAKATQPGLNGSGGLVASSLEMSNVNMAQEFADMITTQRGFQANSRIITTSDSMLEELVNLKR